MNIYNQCHRNVTISMSSLPFQHQQVLDKGETWQWNWTAEVGKRSESHLNCEVLSSVLDTMTIYTVMVKMSQYEPKCWTSWSFTPGKEKNSKQHETVCVYVCSSGRNRFRERNAPCNFLPCHINETQAYNDAICSHTLICKSTLGKSAFLVTHVPLPKAQKLLHVGPREQDGSSQSRP